MEQTRRREFGDRVPTPGPDFHIENLGSDRAANRALVHGEDAVGFPIPAFMIVASVDADHDFHLRLAPEAGIVRPSQAGAGVKNGALVFAIAACDFDSWFVVRVFPKIIVRKQLEPDFLRPGHLVFRPELHPLAAGADAVRFALVRAHGALLRARGHGRRSH